MVFVQQQLARDRLVRNGRRGGRFRQRRLARHLRRVRHGAEPALSQQPRRHVPRDRSAGGLRLRRARRGACGHGRGRRRLRRRRLAGHRPDELLRAGDDAVPQLRRRASRTPASGPASASIASTSASAWTSSTSTTTAGRTSSSPTATSTRRSPIASCTLTYRRAEDPVPQSRERPLRGRVGEGGRRHHGGERRARLRVRRLRQRRRRGHPRQQPGRAADAAAQRRRQRQQLALDQVRRDALEPIGDRHAREGHRVRAQPDRRGDERVRATTRRTISASISALDRRRAPTPSRSPGRPARRRSCATWLPISSSSSRKPRASSVARKPG